MHHQQSQKVLNDTQRDVQSAPESMLQKRWNKPATVKMTPYSKAGDTLRELRAEGTNEIKQKKMLKSKSFIGPAIQQIMEEIKKKEQQ